MPLSTELTDDLVNDLIALIPEDGSRISNGQIRSALEKEAGEPISEAELKELKARVVAMGAAETARGPGGGLKHRASSRHPRPQPQMQAVVDAAAAT